MSNRKEKRKFHIGGVEYTYIVNKTKGTVRVYKTKKELLLQIETEDDVAPSSIKKILVGYTVAKFICRLVNSHFQIVNEEKLTQFLFGSAQNQLIKNNI